MTRQMTGAKMVVQALKDQGVDTVFGYPGGAVLPIYDEIFQQNDMRHILVRHEQGAVHAAEGYARSTGKPGVCLVTSGPGATNAVTGLTDALLDSIPKIDQPAHQRLNSIGGRPPQLIEPPPGCRFAPRCARAAERCGQDEPALKQAEDSGAAHLYACCHPLKSEGEAA